MRIEFVCDDEVYMILSEEAKKINLPKETLINQALKHYFGVHASNSQGRGEGVSEPYSEDTVIKMRRTGP